MTFTSYNIDGWYFAFPQDWKMSLDKEQQTPQVVFDVLNDDVTIYISTWNFQQPETGELVSVENISSLVLHTFELRKIERLDGFNNYYPQGFITYLGRSITADNNVMISCFICIEGSMLSFYIVCDENVDFEKYLQYIKSIERD